ncbi:MAG: lipid-binding SYLF domain-containing protein [Deltaproteobacteria bacterium]|nr:lipid-binding SYLF domain-containing protein [Deltaproteobacteria bacterium]
MKPLINTSRVLKTSVACFLAIFLMAMSAGSPMAQEADKAQITVDRARVSFMNFMSDPEMEWFQKNLKNLKGVLIVPSLIKGGFIWGGSGGHGVLLVRDETSGAWSQPVFYSMASVSWGLQIGGSKSEVILAILKQRGLESLYKLSFKLGGDVSVAAGPVGIGAGGKGITADMASFARAKGAYAGIALDGAVIKVSDDRNAAYYGKSVRPTDIIVKQAVGNPGSYKLRQALAEHSK